MSAPTMPKTIALAGKIADNEGTTKEVPGRAANTPGVDAHPKEVNAVTDHTVSLRRPRITLVCDECGREYPKYQSQISPTQQKHYCSNACLGRSKRHGSVLYCDLCDTSFYRRFGEQDAQTRVHQFCSRSCYTQWRAINRKPDTYPKDGAVHLHRTVAERVLGRRLLPGEVVHHIDLNKHNADPSNLAVFPDQATHMRCHNGNMSDADLESFRLVNVAHHAA